MHTGPVLKEGHPWKGELDGEDNPRRAAHREIERTRRATIRRLQGEMSRYFVVPQGKKLSVWELLLFGKFANSGSSSTAHLPYFSSCHLSKDRPSCLPGVRTESCGYQLDAVRNLKRGEEVGGGGVGGLGDHFTPTKREGFIPRRLMLRG